MINYTLQNQLSLEGFSHPFDRNLLADNRWVKLAKAIPWDELTAVYSKKLQSGSGRNSVDIRHEHTIEFEAQTRKLRSQ